MRNVILAAAVAAMALAAPPALADQRDQGQDHQDNGWHGDQGGGNDHRDNGWHGDDHRDNGWHGDYNRGYGPGGRGNPDERGHHAFRSGERFRGDWAPGYRSANWRAYHLRRPPHGYHWVWYDGNFMLVAISTGIIASILAGSMR